MSIIADTGGLYALLDSGDLHHDAVRAVVDQIDRPLVVPSTILTELDYLLRTKIGVKAEIVALDNVLRGAFVLEPIESTDLLRCRELLLQYRDLDIGLADASVVAVAERLGTHRILTVDLRDFRAMQSRLGKPFLLLPADAS